MKKSTDEAVLDLLRKVQKKKDEIQAASRKPQWKTNCAITFTWDVHSGDAAKRLNIITIRDQDVVANLYASLLSYQEYQQRARQMLGLNQEISYLGYSIADWLSDLQTRSNQLGIEQKKRELDELDKRVNSLITPEQRREMELEALQSILSD